MTDAFTVVHGIRDGRSRIEEGGGTKVAGEQGRETKQGVLMGRRNGCGGGVCVVTGVSVIVIVRVGGRFGESIFLGGCGTGDRTNPASDVVLELGRGFEVWFLDGTRRSCRSGLVYGEGELHTLDGAGTTIDIGLAGTFFFCCALTDDVRRVVALETRGLELLDAPGLTE